MNSQTMASKLKESHADLLELALARPGVREAMQVYSNWLEKEQVLNQYRSVVQKSAIVTTTNTSSTT